jgi:hypothetical protein
MTIAAQPVVDIRLESGAMAAPSRAAAGRRFEHVVSNAFSVGVAIGILVALTSKPSIASVVLLGAVVLIQALSNFGFEAPEAGEAEPEIEEI